MTIRKALTFKQAQNVANEIIKKEGGFPIERLIHPDGTWTFITENSDICGIKETRTEDYRYETTDKNRRCMG